MIPGIVHVGLIGFSADGGNNYSLDLNEYERYLENMYKFNMVGFIILVVVGHCFLLFFSYSQLVQKMTKIIL